MEHGRRSQPIGKLYSFSACLVTKRSEDGKLLFVLIKEKAQKGGGWYFPGGKVDRGETFQQAAIRETKEEAGINVKLTGLLRLEYNNDWEEIRCLFSAIPADDAPLKNFEDEHSQGAIWEEYDKLHLYEYRDDDYLPACQAFFNKVPTCPKLLNENQTSTVFSTKRVGDPIVLRVYCYLRNGDKFLLMSTEFGWLLPYSDMKFPDHFQTKIKDIIYYLQSVTNLVMILNGILQIKHTTPKEPGDIGYIEVLYLATVCKDAPLDNQPSFKWMSITSTEAKSYFEHFGGIYESIANDNLIIYSVHAISDSILAKWIT